MRLWIGVDDTDGREGGCTTALAAAFIDALPDASVVGLPRLVRLNPNIPWKTRGNAAVSLVVETGATAREVADALAPIVERESAPPAEGKGPALVVAPRAPPEAWYWRCVRDVADAADAAALAATIAAEVRTWGAGRGIVGALGAMAWPAVSPTYEAIAYREPGRVGTRREVDPESVAAMEARFPEVFDSLDPANGHPVMVPGTPCPVLFGIRATRPGRLRAAVAAVRGEPVHHVTVFATNHASDDHLADARCADVRWPRSVRVTARVAGRWWERRGGHVFLPLEDETGSVVAAAFEPTKAFRRVVRSLAPGDVVRACGGVTRNAAAPTVNLEKLEILALAHGRTGAAVPAAPAPGWYEVPPSARRHLSRPLRFTMPPREAAKA